MSKHLWEIDHPYYGPDHCWYATGQQARDDSMSFESWEMFATPSSQTPLEDIGNLLYDFDDDLNFLYRWDWKRADPDDYWLSPGAHDDETEALAEALKTDTLQLFFMLQRKGRMVYAEVKVTEADEPAVFAWLRTKAAYMQQMWAPLLEVTA